MSKSYVGEIRMFAGNFAPDGWMFCDGSLLAISEQETLYNLIGTTYGGDGQTTFNLPDLRSRVPLGMSGTYLLAQRAGEEDVTSDGGPDPLPCPHPPGEYGRQRYRPIQCVLGGRSGPFPVRRPGFHQRDDESRRGPERRRQPAAR